METYVETDVETYVETDVETDFETDFETDVKIMKREGDVGKKMCGFSKIFHRNIRYVVG